MIGGSEPAVLPGFPRGRGIGRGPGTVAMDCEHEGLFEGPAASLVSIDEDLSQSFGSAGLISPSQQQQNAFPMGAATGGMSDDGFEEDEDEYGGMKDRDSEDDPLAMTMRLPRGKTFLSVAREAAIEEREEREEREEGGEGEEGEEGDEGTQEQMGEEGDEGEEREEREENNENGSSRYVRRGSMVFGDEEATDDVDDDGDGATAIDVAALCIDILEKRLPFMVKKLVSRYLEDGGAKLQEWRNLPPGHRQRGHVWSPPREEKEERSVDLDGLLEELEGLGIGQFADMLGEEGRQRREARKEAIEALDASLLEFSMSSEMRREKHEGDGESRAAGASLQRGNGEGGFGLSSNGSSSGASSPTRPSRFEAHREDSHVDQTYEEGEEYEEYERDEEGDGDGEDEDGGYYSSDDGEERRGIMIESRDEWVDEDGVEHVYHKVPKGKRFEEFDGCEEEGSDDDRDDRGGDVSEIGHVREWVKSQSDYHHRANGRGGGGWRGGVERGRSMPLKGGFATGKRRMQEERGLVGGAGLHDALARRQRAQSLQVRQRAQNPEKPLKRPSGASSSRAHTPSWVSRLSVPKKRGQQGSARPKTAPPRSSTGSLVSASKRPSSSSSLPHGQTAAVPASISVHGGSSRPVTAARARMAASGVKPASEKAPPFATPKHVREARNLFQDVFKASPAKSAGIRPAPPGRPSSVKPAPAPASSVQKQQQNRQLQRRVEVKRGVGERVG